MKGLSFFLVLIGFVLLQCCCVLMTYCIAGNKVNNIDVVYTPWSNLKKTASMDVGQVGFYSSKMVSFFVW